MSNAWTMTVVRLQDMTLVEGEPCPACGKRYRALYETWHQMKQRCLNPNAPNYHSYGGRGIKIDPRWLNSYEQFAEDMGDKPSTQHTLDRIDVDGDYTPNNCRWASHTEQHRNRRDTRWVEYEGERLTISEWAERLGITKQSLSYRLKHWPLDDVFTRPAQDGRRQRYDARQ